MLVAKGSRGDRQRVSRLPSRIAFPKPTDLDLLDALHDLGADATRRWSLNVIGRYRPYSIARTFIKGPAGDVVEDFADDPQMDCLVRPALPDRQPLRR